MGRRMVKGPVRRVAFAAIAWHSGVIAAAIAQTYEFPLPSDDRWHYPFNFTPGVRPVASCFSSVGNITYPTFNDRDGVLVVAWDTSELIEPGLCPERYAIESVRITLTSVSGARWPIDLTVDEWFTFDFNNDGAINADGVPRGQPGDADGESDDEDSGRPLELFGAAFGPVHSYDTWTETSFYVGANQFTNSPRDPFPFVFQDESGGRLHVEDSVKGTHNEDADPPVGPFTPTPWAIGMPQNYVPGSQSMPFDVTFDVDLELSDGAVRRYFQEQLSGGRLLVVITSLQETVMFGQGPGELPAFFTKEGLGVEVGAKAPQLTITLSTSRHGDWDADCDVDLDDYRLLAACLAGPEVTPWPPPPLTAEECLAVFDFDGDADVDEEDVAAFARVFTGS